MTWQMDSSHSEILFSVRHMMISKVRGQFENFRGNIEFDPNNLEATTVDVVIDAESLNSRNDDRDTHLKSADFLEVEEYPHIHFKSSEVRQTQGGQGKLFGDLTIKDITRPVVLDVTYNGMAQSPWGTTSAGFSASGKINRKNWDLTWNQALETGGVLVGEDINIAIELELVKVEEPVPAD